MSLDVATPGSSRVDGDDDDRPVRHWPFPYHKAATISGDVVAVMRPDVLHVYRLLTNPAKDAHFAPVLRLDADAPRNFHCFDCRSLSEKKTGRSTTGVVIAINDGRATRAFEWRLDNAPKLVRASAKASLPSRVHALGFLDDLNDSSRPRLAVVDASHSSSNCLTVFAGDWATPLVSTPLDQPCCSLLATARDTVALAPPGGHVVIVDVKNSTSSEKARALKRIKGVRALCVDDAGDDVSAVIAATDTGFVSDTQTRWDLAAATEAARRARLDLVGISTADGALVAFSHAALLAMGQQHPRAPPAVSTRYQPLLAATFRRKRDGGDAAQDLLVLENPWIHVANAQRLRPIKRQRFGF